jgi:hypothetical protein
MGVIKQTNYVELVGVDEQVAQNTWGGSVQIPFKAETQGIFVHTVLARQGYDKAAGAFLSLTGKIVFFMGDPAVAAGTALAALTRAQVNKIVAVVDVAAADWYNMDDVGTDASALAVLHMAANEGVIPLPRMADGDLYAAWLHTLATAINSGATDQEDIYVKLVYDS